ncbi:amidohydrolase family protein [uncultured Oscillibacter sp.]|uniref:N-acyl-D-amino-acid deacylase family protein n=1 Tax=uncultured Oscillibacter sp. TaxID=876091 RepID=UPI002805CF2A|nr:amidohydrolase family protein [uncultured Oscillibacter sp.]
MLDLIIKNGMIVDGSGAKAFPGEVAVKDGKIVAVKDRIDEPAGEVIDAKGHYVTPGFIDMHRHGDAAVFRPNFGEVEVRQGITSIVNGQCGLSIAPCPEEHRAEIFSFLNTIVGSIDPGIPFHTFAEYTAQVKKQPLPINVGCCVGNGTVRSATNGFANGKLSPDKVRIAQEHIRASIEAGALGVTLGLVYAPENQYDVESLVEVLQPMRDYDIPLATHIRGEGRTLHDSQREVLAVAKALGVQLEFSHFKSTGRAFWGQFITDALALVENARAEGQRVTIDAYPWTAGATQLYQYLPPDFQDGGYDAACARMADPVQRARLTEILKAPQEYFENQLYNVGWENTVITGVSKPENQPYVGLTVTEMAEKMGKDPYDAAYDLLIDEHCNVGMINFISDEADNQRIIQKEYCSIISDSLYAEGGLPHPRVYASFPRVLATFVREKKALSLESAIHKITRQPAEVYRLEQKGLIREGMDADIVIFDLDRVETKATYVNPKQFPTGYDYVLVNGVVVVKDDVMDKTVHPGTVLTNRYAK